MTGKKWLGVFIFVILAVLVGFKAQELWSRMIWLMMPAQVRPTRISFPVEHLSDQQFEATARQIYAKYATHQSVDSTQQNPELYQGLMMNAVLNTPSAVRATDFRHIEYFREAGIRSYEGPKTCLKCHKTIKVKGPDGKFHEEDLMDNITHSAHFRFYTNKHPNVYGFNGQLADNFPMGKIDRPCPKPGSFAMSSWASPVITAEGDTFSEGCGQCHMASQPGAPLAEMMPGYSALPEEKDAMDCLICHSAEYDMNLRTVQPTGDGRYYWGQDRRMIAAMTVTKPKSQYCLRCHQHNFGGDIYVDSADPSFMQSMVNTGYRWPRVLHPGSKRGTPFSPSWDVHAAAGVQCTDCHETRGHLIAKGTHTTTMMSNDLPDVEVSCEKCHTATPHIQNPELRAYLNAHTDKIACQTCHLPNLHPDNATKRDFANPTQEEEGPYKGLWIYTDSVKATNGYDGGLDYVWWNGSCTFLGNPIGDNPSYPGKYVFYDPDYKWPEYADYDYKAWFERVMRPIAQQGKSKLYVMKPFQGRQHIDLANAGPFGGMYIPYNLPTYYTTGNPDSAAKMEMLHPMLKMMYGFMFKVYMMDKFMQFMDIPSWNTEAYQDASQLVNVEPRWIPMTARLETDHAIRKDGALTCTDCHRQGGVLDFEKLGYPPERAYDLTHLKEVQDLVDRGVIPPQGSLMQLIAQQKPQAEETEEKPEQ